MKQVAYVVSLLLVIAVPPFVMSQKSAPEVAANGRHVFNQACAACHDTLGSATKYKPT